MRNNVLFVRVSQSRQGFQMQHLVIQWDLEGEQQLSGPEVPLLGKQDQNQNSIWIPSLCVCMQCPNRRALFYFIISVTKE